MIRITDHINNQGHAAACPYVVIAYVLRRFLSLRVRFPIR
jgi:hypothetical protein